jgi:hypothetical protein
MECHIIIFKAIKVEISRSLGIKMKMVAIRVEVVVGTQMKVNDVGSGLLMKMTVVEGTNGGMMVMILRGEVVLVTFPTSGGETGQMMTMQGQEEDISHGVVVILVCYT